MFQQHRRRTFDEIADDTRYPDDPVVDEDDNDDQEEMSFDRMMAGSMPSSRRRIVEPTPAVPWCVASLNDESGELGKYVRSELESNPADWAQYDRRDNSADDAAVDAETTTPLALDSAPIDDLKGSLRVTLLRDDRQQQSAELLRYILRQESSLFLTEQREYTEGRSAYANFVQNCRLRLGQRAPLLKWRQQWVGPWAGMQLCILEREEASSLNELVSTIMSVDNTVVDMYLLDECFYVFCVFCPAEDGEQFVFEGFLFTQSSQSHRGDMARQQH